MAEAIIKEEPLDPSEEHPSKDSDCEETCFFTQLEVDNTRRCLENTRLIIKDFETQLDWHLQQYMMLRNGINEKDLTQKHDLLSISELSALIASHPEGNKNFIKRKIPLENGTRKRQKEIESEDSDLTEEDSEDYDLEEELESEEAQVPKTRKKPRKVQVKDEIVEEFHELVEPKIERESEEEIAPPVEKKKRGRKPGKKKGVATVTPPIKECTVVLNKLEVKNEVLERDELIHIFQEKCITNLEENRDFLVLTNDNIDNCNKQDAIIVLEAPDVFPDFAFREDISKLIINDCIKLVQYSIYEQYLKRSET